MAIRSVYECTAPFAVRVGVEVAQPHWFERVHEVHASNVAMPCTVARAAVALGRCTEPRRILTGYAYRCPNTTHHNAQIYKHS